MDIERTIIRTGLVPRSFIQARISTNKEGDEQYCSMRMTEEEKKMIIEKISYVTNDLQRMLEDIQSIVMSDEYTLEDKIHELTYIKKICEKSREMYNKHLIFLNKVKLLVIDKHGILEVEYMSDDDKVKYAQEIKIETELLEKLRLMAINIMDLIANIIKKVDIEIRNVTLLDYVQKETMNVIKLVK